MSDTTLDDRGIIVTCPKCAKRNRIPFGSDAKCGNCGTPLPAPAEPIEAPSSVAFDALIQKSRLPVVVDFWAPWCKPCDAVEPHLRSLVEEWGERARLVRVNVDEEPGLSGRYGVLSLPTVILFAGGEPRATVYGAQPRARFEREFAPHVVDR